MCKTKTKIINYCLFILLIASFIFSGCGSKTSNIDKLITQYKEVQVSINTTKGEIIVSLRPDLMPITVENFVTLVEKNFYKDLTFHRVENWVIQGGDPKGNGTGGSDKKIKLETHKDLLNIRGAIAMARSTDKDSATSQFYILKKDAPHLDGNYAVFGNVIKGLDIVDKIAIGDKITEVKILKKVDK